MLALDLVITTANVRLRELAGVTQPILGVIPRGTTVERLPGYGVTRDELTWGFVRWGGRWGYVATTYLRPLSSPVPPGGERRFGLNFLPGGRKDALVDAFRKKGKRPEVWCVVNGSALGFEASLVVARYQPYAYEPDPFSFQGKVWTPKAWLDWWLSTPLGGYRRESGRELALQFHNEVFRFPDPAQRSGDWLSRMQRWVEWEIDFIEVARRAGVLVTYGNFPVYGFWAQDVPLLTPMLLAGEKAGMILRVNCYDFEDVPSPHREEGLTYPLPLLAARPTARWVVGECGFADLSGNTRYRGRARLAALLDRVVSSYQGQRGLMGVALWCSDTWLDRWRADTIPVEDYDLIADKAL